MVLDLRDIEFFQQVMDLVKKLIFFRADMNPYVHVDNKNKIF